MLDAFFHEDLAIEGQLSIEYDPDVDQFSTQPMDKCTCRFKKYFASGKQVSTSTIYTRPVPSPYARPAPEPPQAPQRRATAGTAAKCNRSGVLGRIPRSGSDIDRKGTLGIPVYQDQRLLEPSQRVMDSARAHMELMPTMRNQTSYQSHTADAQEIIRIERAFCPLDSIPLGK